MLPVLGILTKTIFSVYRINNTLHLQQNIFAKVACNTYHNIFQKYLYYPFFLNLQDVIILGKTNSADGLYNLYINISY